MEHMDLGNSNKLNTALYY